MCDTLRSVINVVDVGNYKCRFCVTGIIRHYNNVFRMFFVTCKSFVQSEMLSTHIISIALFPVLTSRVYSLGASPYLSMSNTRLAVLLLSIRIARIEKTPAIKIAKIVEMMIDSRFSIVLFSFLCTSVTEKKFRLT